jgi:phage tail sheath protein FI
MGIYVEGTRLGAKPIEGASTSTAAFIGAAKGGPVLTPTLVTSWSDFVSKFGGLASNPRMYLGYAVDSFFKNQGKRAYIVRVASEGTDYPKGISCLEKVDGVNVLAIPGQTSKSVQQALVDHCQKFNRFAILDSGPNVDSSAVIAQKNSISSTKGYAAFYYPWVKVYDPDLRDYVLIPPSGAIAGVYARTDIERGVHKAPANVAVTGMADMERNLTDTEQESLNLQGINVIRSLPGRGMLVWGARTVASDPTWKYVNVRRLFIHLEESISKGTRWVVFEPNNEKLWASVKQAITDFLIQEWKGGALLGRTQEEAFFVRCDRTTMTQNDLDNGRFVVIVGVAPIKPAELMAFRVGQWKEGSEIRD